MKKSFKENLLLGASFLIIGSAALGVVQQTKAQRVGTRIYSENVSSMSGILTPYDQASTSAFRMGGDGQSRTARATAVGNYLQTRAGIKISPELLSSESGQALSVDALADVITEQSLDRIQKSDPKSFVGFLHGVKDNGGMFFFLTAEGSATVLSKEDQIFGLAYARKTGDRAVLKALALPRVRGAVEATTAYYSQASPEFARVTSGGKVFSGPEAALVTYSLLSGDYSTMPIKADGRRLYGVGGTVSQFPVEFFFNDEMVKRIVSAR
jgi:hypothetical protein